MKLVLRWKISDSAEFVLRKPQARLLHGIGHTWYRLSRGKLLDRRFPSRYYWHASEMQIRSCQKAVATLAIRKMKLSKCFDNSSFKCLKTDYLRTFKSSLSCYFRRSTRLSLFSSVMPSSSWTKPSTVFSINLRETINKILILYSY